MCIGNVIFKSMLNKERGDCAKDKILDYIDNFNDLM